jgi:hypothetical protein
MGGDGVILSRAAYHRGRGCERRAVHQPFDQVAIGIVKDDISTAVSVKIADALDTKPRARCPDCSGSAEQCSRTVQQPDREIGIIAAEQDIVTAIAVEVAGTDPMISSRR